MELKDLLIKATKEAGVHVKDRFHTSFKIEHKEGVNNIVTEVDKQSEAIIIDLIREHYPGHSILAEESGLKDTPSEYEWIIDPIDGTTNFAHGIPLCGVSVAVRKGKELLCGAVYNPMMDEFFFAEKGGGAFLNDVQIHVSKKEDFASACLVTGFPYRMPAQGEHPIKVFERFIMQGLPVRRLGSAALDLCWVACGRFDGFWEYNLSAWDVAAGYLIVQEAGGKLSNFDGGETDVFDKETLATNGKIHEPMRRLIRNEK